MEEPVWIDERDALTLHDRLLALHGGARGLRDETLLQSALARPKQHFTYAEDSNTVQLASLYTAGVVRNHPFIDGNKRTGFVLGILFLDQHRLDWNRPCDTRQGDKVGRSNKARPPP